MTPPARTHGTTTLSTGYTGPSRCREIPKKILPADWQRFVTWIRDYLERHGIDLLRVKGLVYASQNRRPIIIHGVQHVFHEPTALSAWPGDVAQTQLVFIGIALDWDEIAASLTDCVDPSASDDSDPDAKPAERLSG